ncbi:MAG: Na+/H+ antiporter NhaC family protein [Planctomycetaceae bacterium]
MMQIPEAGQRVLESWPVLKLAPPLLAIGLAILTREVNLALVVATFCGCLLLADLSPAEGIDQFCSVLVRQLANDDHAAVILFTVLLGAMIAVMNDSGGTGAIVNRISRFARTRQQGQLLTWLAGLVVFFDDYANTMLIGGSMRPLCDRLKISRAKLAFLIDSTAAPVAGLALSTWTATEIGYILQGLEGSAISADAGSVFLATLPYRIYPIMAIVVVGAVAATGRDFGPMLKAERLAADPQGRLPDGELTPDSSAAMTAPETGSMWFAVMPVLTLIGVVVTGYLRDVDSYRLLLLGSLAGATVSVLLPLGARKKSAIECSESVTRGIASMVPAVTVLVLAWAVSDICQTPEVDTGGYVGSLVADSIRPEFLPAVAFITASLVALAVGSSFATMGVLVPIFISLAWKILTSADAVPDVDNPVFLATVGAILAGAIFGDHCSPISDTTVLSSAAAGCHHLQHVTTQLPYAILMAVMTVLLGYLPIGFGVPWWIALPGSSAACVAVFVFLGKRSE